MHDLPATCAFSKVPILTGDRALMVCTLGHPNDTEWLFLSLVKAFDSRNPANLLAATGTYDGCGSLSGIDADSFLSPGKDWFSNRFLIRADFLEALFGFPLEKISGDTLLKKIVGIAMKTRVQLYGNWSFSNEAPDRQECELRSDILAAAMNVNDSFCSRLPLYPSRFPLAS